MSRHADAVAEDRAAGIGARRIDRDDADAACRVRADLCGELRDQRRLAAARHAGDADRHARGPRAGRSRQRRPRLRQSAASAREISRAMARVSPASTRATRSQRRRRGAITRRSDELRIACSRNTARSSITRRALKSVRGNVPGATTSTSARKPEHLLQLVRRPRAEALASRRPPRERRGVRLDAQQQLVHRALAGDDDAVLAAVAGDLVERRVDLARIDVLAADREHVVDAAEDALRQPRIGAPARVRARPSHSVRSPETSRIIGCDVRSRCV